jgi:hypothetical protein
MSKIITIRIDDVLHKSARRKTVDQSTTFQAVGEALLREWAEGKRSVEASRPALRESHAEEVELLRFILDNGSKDDAEWIRGNLRNFAEAIRSRADLGAEERRLVEEYRKGSYEKRRRMLAFGATQEELGPEVMPEQRPAVRRKSG